MVFEPYGIMPQALVSVYFLILDDVIDSRILSIFILSTRHLAKLHSIIYRTYYRIEVIIENRLKHSIFRNLQIPRAATKS